MHLNNSNGYWYLRRHTSDGKETIAKFGKGDRPTIYRPELYNEKAENVIARLPDGSIDTIITDPPYGIDYESSWEGPEAVASKLGKISNDEDVEFVADVFEEFPRILDEDSHCYVFTRWDAYPVMMELMPDELDLNTVLIWDKKSHGLGDLSTWAPTHEFIMHYEYGDPELVGSRPQNVLRYLNAIDAGETVIHQTQKPRKLMERLIEKSTEQGDVVFDPFGGSYVTARAAQRTFRRSVSCELDPEVHRNAESLTNAQFHDDPEFGIDWVEVSNLSVERPEIVDKRRVVA